MNKSVAVAQQVSIVSKQNPYTLSENSIKLFNLMHSLTLKLDDQCLLEKLSPKNLLPNMS